MEIHDDCKYIYTILTPHFLNFSNIVLDRHLSGPFEKSNDTSKSLLYNDFDHYKKTPLMDNYGFGEYGKLQIIMTSTKYLIYCCRLWFFKLDGYIQSKFVFNIL